MIYALRQNGMRPDVLVEFKSEKEMAQWNVNHRDNDSDIRYRYVNSVYARAWVRGGCMHETGLWVDDDGKVRYAAPDPEGVQ